MAGVSGRSEASKAQGKAIRFTKKMMKFSHQWEVQDLIAAGLNPILSATGGSGPIGSAAAPFGPNTAQEVSQIAGAAASGTTAARQAATMKSVAGKAKSDAAISKEGIKIAKSRAKIEKNFETKSIHDTIRAGDESSTASEVAIQARDKTRQIRAETAISEALEKLNKSQFGEVMLNVERATSAVGKVFGGGVQKNIAPTQSPPR